MAQPKARSNYHYELGQHIEMLVKRKGYKSLYDFWVNCAGDRMSRASLNYLAAGTGDPKLSTLLLMAELLDIPLKNIFP